jgi:hypothetical protein
VEKDERDTTTDGAEPRAESEITPAMIEAGVTVLKMFNYEFESFEACVSRIFSAMDALRSS